jgi:hypothetical protein
MTLAELRAQVRQHVVILPAAHLTDDQIDEFIQTAIERLEQAHDWRFQQYSVQLPYPDVGLDYVTLPDDFVVEASVYLVASNGSLVPVNRLDAGRRAVAEYVNAPSMNESYQVPALDALYYYIWQMRLYLVNQSAADPITVQLDYYREFPRPSTGSDDQGFLQYHPRAVLWGALQVAYLYLHEIEMSQGVATIYTDLTAGASARDHGFRVGATQSPRTR